MVDQDILEQIQYTMIETPDGGASWESGLWTRDEVLGYLNERQDRLLRETHMVISTATIAVTSPYGVRHALPADWIMSVRVTWGAATTTTRELARSDSFEADHSMVYWPTVSGIPKVYVDNDATPLIIQVAPLPSTDGTITVHYVPTGTLLTGNGVNLAVSDEFAPTVKYGALSDMFAKVGRANDPVRAAYCTERFQLGTEIAQILLKGFK